MSEPFIGEIRAFGFNYAPRGWAVCDGQLLPIAQHQALFALLGTTYGGDGRTTFALPDLRGRTAMHEGTGPGLSPRTLGEQSGTETNTLVVGQLPAHNHGFDVPATDDNRTTNRPDGAVPARGGAYAATSDGSTLGPPMATDNTGNNQPVNNLPPYLVVTYAIALQGIFPPRD